MFACVVESLQRKWYTGEKHTNDAKEGIGGEIMDISYLLFLQELREASNAIWVPFFEWVSRFVIDMPIYLILMGIYWCFCKEAGAFMMSNMSGGYVVNQIVKNTCCVYRPWIRDARVMPAGDAITTATGYSFPSGHTQLAVTSFGSIAVWQKKRKWLVALCVLAILLIGFSRNFLGVHTPQDVVVSMILCVLVIWLNGKAFRWALKEKNDLRYAIISTVFCALFLVYITLKPYPMDMVDGKLLVDPFHMMTDCYNAAGCFLGFVWGWIIERRWIQFKVEGSAGRRIIRFVIGAAIFYVLFHYTRTPIIGVFGAHIGSLVSSLLVYIFVSAIYPFFIKMVQKRF